VVQKAATRVPSPWHPGLAIGINFQHGFLTTNKDFYRCGHQGASYDKLINKAKTLLEDMASSNYHWASERGIPKKEGRNAIDAFTMLATKVDALFQKANHLQENASHGDVSSGSFGQVNVCEVCGVQRHKVSDCQLGYSFQDLTIEQENVPYNFNNRLQNDPYSSTFNRVGGKT